jgi:hypothetical protein
VEPTKTKITTSFTVQHFERKGDYLLVHIDECSTIMFELCGLRPNMNKPMKVTLEVEIAQPE